MEGKSSKIEKIAKGLKGVCKQVIQEIPGSVYEPTFKQTQGELSALLTLPSNDVFMVKYNGENVKVTPVSEDCIFNMKVPRDRDDASMYDFSRVADSLVGKLNSSYQL